jgi:hypothetical protein
MFVPVVLAGKCMIGLRAHWILAVIGWQLVRKRVFGIIVSLCASWEVEDHVAVAGFASVSFDMFVSFMCAAPRSSVPVCITSK